MVQRMLAGEERAFREFFDGHFARLYRFVLPRVAGDADAAEEIVQTVLCDAISALRSWRGEAALFTWLCTFCRHEISGHYRRASRLPVPLGLIEDPPAAREGLESLAGRLEGPAPGGAAASEVSRLVHETLDRLPARYGDALEWKYIQGLSVEEIARRLGTGAKAVESLLTRARLAFRRAFDPGREDER